MRRIVVLLAAMAVVLPISAEARAEFSGVVVGGEDARDLTQAEYDQVRARYPSMEAMIADGRGGAYVTQDDGGSPTSAMSTSSEEEAPKNCSAFKVVVYFELSTGPDFWRFNHKANWCWRASRLVWYDNNTRVNWTTWGWTAWWSTFDYRGVQSSSTTGDWPDWWRKWVQGKMVAANVINHYPNAAIKVLPYGNLNWSGGCGC